MPPATHIICSHILFVQLYGRFLDANIVLEKYHLGIYEYYEHQDLEEITVWS